MMFDNHLATVTQS